MIVKVLGSAETISANSNISSARLVRAYAPTTTTVTIQTAGAAETKGSFVMPGGSVEIIEKDPTDEIASTQTDLSCSPIAFNVS